MALFNFDYKEEPLASPAKFAGRMLANIFVALVLVVEMVFVLGGRYFGLAGSPPPPQPPPNYSNTRELGQLVYTDYVYPFEIAAVILLVAIVAAIALTLRARRESKHLDPAQQLGVRREDRVRIVKMPAEKEEQG